MKKVLILLLLFPCAIYAQKCKETKDEFTGRVSKSTSITIKGSMVFNPSLIIKLTLQKTEANKTISIVYTSPFITNTVKPEDCAILLKMSDGTVLKFKPSNRSKLTTETNGIKVLSVLTIISDIPEDEIDKLNRIAVEKVRISYNDDEEEDINISSKKARYIKDAARCLM